MDDTVIRRSYEALEKLGLALDWRLSAQHRRYTRPFAGDVLCKGGNTWTDYIPGDERIGCRAVSETMFGQINETVRKSLAATDLPANVKSEILDAWHKFRVLYKRAYRAHRDIYDQKSRSATLGIARKEPNDSRALWVVSKALGNVGLAMPDTLEEWRHASCKAICIRGGSGLRRDCNAFAHAMIHLLVYGRGKPLLRAKRDQQRLLLIVLQKIRYRNFIWGEVANLAFGRAVATRCLPSRDFAVKILKARFPELASMDKARFWLNVLGNL